MTRFKSLRFSNPAEKDLLLIGEYTRREWGDRQKTKYLGIIQQAFKALALSESVGILRDDVAEGLYCYSVQKHLIFYRETKNELVVLRVLHQRMNVTRYLER